jgi:hypothetical protein
MVGGSFSLMEGMEGLWSGGEKVEGTCARPVGDAEVLRPLAFVNGWKFRVGLDATVGI